MFDWARGSVLKKMVTAKLPCAVYDPWLKGWASAWPFAILEIPNDIKVLDVGSGNNPYYAKLFAKRGLEAHVLEKRYTPRPDSAGWGVSKEVIKNNPEIKFHLGLAGQKKGPPRYFDLITCISVMEHIYDSTYVMDPKNPMPHLDALADMIRMLKPGGVLVLTYDFFLNDMPHWRGWDFLADIMLLQLCGIPLLNPKMPLKSRTDIYNCEDTLFMAPEGILSFADTYYRSTSIGIMYRKPGGEHVIKYSPHKEIAPLLFSEFEPSSKPITFKEVKRFFSTQSRSIISKYVRHLKSSL